MNCMRVFLLGLLLSAPALGSAQWQWIDASGRRVFSDQPPPPEVPARSILKQPGQRATSSAPADPAPTTSPNPPAAQASPPQPGGLDKTLEARRKQAADAEAQKRKAEEERIAKLRAENCSRARQAKATIESGIRLARVNDKGEREILDDDARAAETRRLDEVIASECQAS